MRSGGRPIVATADKHSSAGPGDGPPPDGRAGQLAEAAAADAGPPLPRLVQRAHGDQEEQDGSRAHDGRGQARGAGQPGAGRFCGSDQPETQPEFGGEHGQRDRTLQAQREQAGRPDALAGGMCSPGPPRLGHARAEQQGGEQRDLRLPDLSEHRQPPIVIVALKQPVSRAPPSSTNAAMVRSAIRPFCEVPQVTQRSQNNRAVAPHPVTGSVLVSVRRSRYAAGACCPPTGRAGGRTPARWRAGPPLAGRPSRPPAPPRPARSPSPGPAPGRPARAGHPAPPRARARSPSR